MPGAYVEGFSIMDLAIRDETPDQIIARVVRDNTPKSAVWSTWMKIENRVNGVPHYRVAIVWSEVADRLDEMRLLATMLAQQEFHQVDYLVSPISHTVRELTGTILVRLDEDMVIMKDIKDPTSPTVRQTVEEFIYRVNAGATRARLGIGK